jgi:hypothetical protein
MLQLSWDFIGPLCTAVVKSFWKDGKLTHQMLAVVIKLIYKGGERSSIKNWWPISLCNCPYKLVAKILASRVKVLLPDLVDAQKTGFVSGRHIQDNILAVKLLQESARKSKDPLAMMLFDFAKAYDLFDHKLIWDVLESMGFCSEFITLVQGLITGSSAKVNFNGLFTAWFPLYCGVKQGCPIAPLIFALSTQPLMVILKEHLASGAVKGIPIGAGNQILFQLFADDTGLFFHATEDNFHTAVMDCLHIFERISGARVNLDKSTIVQLDSRMQPAWFSLAGCKIAASGQVLKYLGCQFGRNLTQQQEVNFVLEKVRKHLRHWSNRLLTMSSKLIAIKHILCAIPVFYLMILDFT